MGVEMKLTAMRDSIHREESGFSLIEVTIAAALVLIVAVGVLPMFTQAMVNTQAGSDSSFVSNAARTRVEELFQAPWDSPLVTLTAGTELVTDEYFSLNDHAWMLGAAPVDGSATFTRTTRVRQFSVIALENELLEDSEALDSLADPGQVHLKEIRVTVEGLRTAGPIGPSKRITLTMLKSQ